MKEKAEALAKFCKDNEIEVNFDTDGISVWTKCDLHLKIEDVKPEDLEDAVKTLAKLREHGWETS